MNNDIENTLEGRKNMDESLFERTNQETLNNDEIEDIITHIINEIRIHNLSWDYDVEKHLCFQGCYHFATFLAPFIPNSELVAATKFGKYDHCVVMVNGTFFDAKGEMFAGKYDKYTPMNPKIEKYMQREFGYLDKMKEEKLYQIFSDITPGIIEYINAVKNKQNNGYRRI